MRGKPIAVGVLKTRVVAAASYEARKFGVRSAIVYGQKKLSELIFVRPRFDRYKEISSKIQKIFMNTQIGRALVT
jgi:DNA polymerase-4